MGTTLSFLHTDLSSFQRKLSKQERLFINQLKYNIVNGDHDVIRNNRAKLFASSVSDNLRCSLMLDGYDISRIQPSIYSVYYETVDGRVEGGKCLWIDIKKRDIDYLSA